MLSETKSRIPFEKNIKIGVFDSGLGGLSVWLELIKQLPSVSIVYYADSGNCPYGNKSVGKIIEHSKVCTEFLLKRDCKMIVVACNTATSAAIDYLRANYDVPFIGMEPAIKPAALRTKTGVIGVLATKGTLEGRLFNQTKSKYTKGIQVDVQVGKGLVKQVENLKIDTRKTRALLQKYLWRMIVDKADKIVLGCTHYPFLIPVIQEIIPTSIEIINPAPAVARQAKKRLTKKYKFDKKAQPVYRFFTTGKISILKKFLQHIVPPVLFKTFKIQSIKI